MTERHFKKRQVVRDPHGNHFAIDGVYERSLVLHSVVTKERWEVDIDYAQRELHVVRGVVEA